MSLRSMPKIACCRYFGTMTMWYRQYHRTWLWFCHSRIVVSPSWGLGGSTPGETTSPFTNQRRNGRAFSSLTARGGGLPIGVKLDLEPQTIIVHEWCIGQGEITAEQDDTGLGLRTQVGLDDKDDIQWLQELLVQQLRLVQTGLNIPFYG